MLELLSQETGADGQCEIVGTFIDKLQEDSYSLGETRKKAVFGLAIAYGLDHAFDCQPLRRDGLGPSGGVISPELHEKIR